MACGAGRQHVGEVCGERQRRAGTNPSQTETRNPDNILDSLDSSLFHTAVYDHFIKSPRASTQLTLGPYLVQIWSRPPSNLGALKP